MSEPVGDAGERAEQAGEPASERGEQGTGAGEQGGAAGESVGRAGEQVQAVALRPAGDGTRTATIVVCPLSKVAETAKKHGASRILSLIGNPEWCVTPEGVTDHLVVHVHDIVTANETQILPAESHVQQVIDFARSWTGESPMLVHCWAGISRSTASAFIAACVLQPERDEAEIARELRAASVTAYPNRHFVALADQMLGRDGRMVAAVEEIGRGEPAEEGVPFTLTLQLAGGAGSMPVEP